MQQSIQVCQINFKNAKLKRNTHNGLRKFFDMSDDLMTVLEIHATEALSSSERIIPLAGGRGTSRKSLRPRDSSQAF